MKKNFIALSIGIISFSALTNAVLAQTGGNDVAVNRGSIVSNESDNSAAYSSHATDVKNVKSKAVKDFKKRFNTANAEAWFSSKQGFVSIFLTDGYHSRAYYDKKGNWQYSLIMYGENKMDKGIRAIVKSTYYDMDITLVEEVQIPEGKGYVVHLEDAAHYRMVKINSDGEMETIQELTKQH